MKSQEPEDFVLTKHAEQMLGKRRISVDWVRRTLRWPHWTEPDKSDRILRHAFRELAEQGGKILRVVYDPSAKPRRVVTAFFDRGARRNR